jgi:hypothetical protein
MTAETKKFTPEQLKTLEVVPGTEHENLEGWVPCLTGEKEVRDAMEKAFEYRGDVTLTLKSGERFDAFIFNCQSGPTLDESFVQYFKPASPEKRKVGYAEIASVEFTGRNYARGKHWEDWVKAYNKKKADGEKNIALHPDELD